MRPVMISLFLLLAACGGKQSDNGNNLPPLSEIVEQPGDWSALDLLVGRTPLDSGLLDNSPVAVDLNAALGPELPAFRAAMMRAGPLTRVGPLLVTRSSEAWLVLHPADHSFRAGLEGPRGWREWHTAGSEVPVPAGLARAVGS